MKKLQRYYILLCLIVSLFLLPKSVYAIYQKSFSNPILTAGVNGSWDENSRLLAHILHEDGQFKMWYTGNDGDTDKIGYATSLNGIDWDFSPDNPILSPDSISDLNYSDPFVLHENSNYYMWLTVQNANGSYSIKKSTSPDGISWSTPIPINTIQEWESSVNMVQPSVIHKDGLYYLWYSAVQSGQWKIGLATSLDGNNWTKHNSPVLESTELWEGNSLGGGKVIRNDGKFEMYYHAGDPPGIGYATSNDGIIWEKPENNQLLTTSVGQFDSQKVLSPSVVIVLDLSKKFLYYTGFDGGNYGIGLATEDYEGTASAEPIVLIPGLFGSWNSDAILHGDDPPQSDWIMTPFIHDYEGLINTLKSVGYSDDKNDPTQNLFIFNYDWRDQVESTTGVFNDYLTNTVLPKVGNTPINIVGHSLGGLIARSYAQNYGLTHIDEIITAGTPHGGAIQSYKAWEGGIVENEDFWQRLAYDIVINLNRNGHLTDKDVIREVVPVSHDLLPTFNFLTTEQDQVIPVNSLIHQNVWLSNLESDFPSIFDYFDAFYGVKGETPEMYRVTEADFLENLLGLWQDGKPIETISSNFGDETVLAKSASRSADPATLLGNTNHRELMTNETSISEILDKLGITPDAIITPTPTNSIFPSLFIALQSPATFEVNGPSGNFTSSDGYVFIPNVIGGNYLISVTGNDNGMYTLHSGITTETDSFWKTIVNKTNPGKEDSYNLIVNALNPDNSYIVDQNGGFYLNNAYETVEKLKLNYSHWTLTLAQHSISTALKQLDKEKYKQSGNAIPNAINHLFSFIKKQSIAEPRNTAFNAIEDLISAYPLIKGLSGEKPNTIKINAELLAIEALRATREMKLKLKGNELHADLYIKAINLIEEAKTDVQNGNYFSAEIKLFTAKKLLSDI